MTPRTFAKTLRTKRFAFVTTLESVFAAMAGNYEEWASSTEDRLQRRAANDSAQR